MGKSVTPKYRVETKEYQPVVNGHPEKGVAPIWQQQVWNVTSRTNVHAHGKPTAENLEKFVKVFSASFQPGGVNEHVSKFYGMAPQITQARIVNQFTGQVVAFWVAPMFEVIEVC